MSQSQYIAAHQKSKAVQVEDPLVELYTRKKGRVKLNFRKYSAYQEATKWCSTKKHEVANKEQASIKHFSFGDLGQLLTSCYTLWSFTLTVHAYEEFRKYWCEG